MKLYHIKNCELKRKEKWINGYMVSYPVSYAYNGGIIIKKKWYNGYKVDKPRVPEGYRLTNIGIGLDLNARPPRAEMYLEPIED